MIRCVVVADDLTGANAAGVLLTKRGYEAYTITAETPDAGRLSGCDCIIFPTDSRSLEPTIAYDKVCFAVDALKAADVRVYAKRIDTTLRGNLGAETDAMLDELGDNRVAMIVPCFPSSGRVNVGGYLLVQGVPLHQTAVAQDPKTPVFTPRCAELFIDQSKYPTDSIFLEDLMKGEKSVAQKIALLAAKGVRNIVFDAVSEDDIDQIAGAVVQSGVKFIAVDPGPFTASLCQKLIPAAPKKESAAKKILVAVGSVNAVSRRQVDAFLAAGNNYTVFMETAEFLESEERRVKEIERVAREISEHCAGYAVCGVIGRGIIPEFRVPFEPYMQKYRCTLDDLSRIINAAIAEICCKILEAQKGFEGIYTCGGDITVAVCARLQSVGLKLLGEVLPLASYGEIAGGKYEGLKIVTKGGMVGESDAIIDCVRYLKERLAV